jgi:hypothetical protein
MPQISGVSILPPDNFWNVAVDALPLVANSAAMMAVVNASGNEHIHLDDAIPITLVNSSEPMQHVSGMGSDADPGLYPIPDNVAIEAGDDLHAIVLDTDSGVAYEFFSLRPSAVPGYKWHADIGVKWDLASNAMRTIPADTEPELSSADAAGLPILPGLLRYEEILGGEVSHALRVTCRRTAYARYIWPGTHFTRNGTNPNDPPFGTRWRLKASFDISGFSPMNQTILRGMKKYGLVVADNGMYGGCQHDQDARWGDNQVTGTPGADLLALHLVSLSNFEAVDCSGLMVDSNYMQAGTATQGLVGTDRIGRRTPVAIDSAFAIRGGKLFLAGIAPVVQPLIVIGTYNPVASAGTPYSSIVTPSGGTAPYSFALASGTLPPGLGLLSSGTIIGTPLIGGGYPFSVKVSDAGSQSITIQCSIAVSSPSLAPIITLQPVDQTIHPLPNLTMVPVKWTASAVGNPTPLGTWKVSYDGNHWMDVGTGDSFSFSASAMNRGFYLQVVYTNSQGSMPSNVVKLIIS